MEQAGNRGAQVFDRIFSILILYIWYPSRINASTYKFYTYE